MLTNAAWLLQCVEEGWDERKEAGLPLRRGSQELGKGAGLCEESGWREQEEEEMSDSGRWRRGLGMPNWIPKALESAPLVHKKNTRSQNTWKVSLCEAEETKTWKKASSAAQPAAKNGSTAAANKGLMPSGGPWAEPLHYPEMDESIRSNYINHTEISPLFLWKQMWVILHKSMPSVKYSCTCDVSLSNGHVNSCITAAIDMMWWTSDDRNHKTSFHYGCGVLWVITHYIHALWLCSTSLRFPPVVEEVLRYFSENTRLQVKGPQDKSYVKIPSTWGSHQK